MGLTLHRRVVQASVIGNDGGGPALVQQQHDRDRDAALIAALLPLQLRRVLAVCFGGRYLPAASYSPDYDLEEEQRTWQAEFDQIQQLNQAA